LTANPRPLRTDLSCPACIASGNFILEFSSINSRSHLFSRWCMRASPRGLWSRRQVWLPRMCQRDACWAGEVSLKGSHFATMRDGSPVSRYLYIDLWSMSTTRQSEELYCSGKGVWQLWQSRMEDLICCRQKLVPVSDQCVMTLR